MVNCHHQELEQLHWMIFKILWGACYTLIYIYTHIYSQISNLESLCTQLNSRLHPSSYPSTNIASLTSPPHNIVNQSTQFIKPHAPSPKTCIIIGDNNTKHVKLEDEHLDSFRVATYLIEDIDPNLYAGFKKIWIRVGTNNIKSMWQL